MAGRVEMGGSIAQWRNRGAMLRLEGSVDSDGKIHFPPRQQSVGEFVRQTLATRHQFAIDKSNGFGIGQNNGKDHFADKTQGSNGQLRPHSDDLRTNGHKPEDESTRTNGRHDVASNGYNPEPSSLALPLLMEMLEEAMQQTADQEAAD